MYSAIEATEWGIGQSVNGTGKRKKIRGAYTIETETGRKVRAFRESEGGLEAAQEWARTLNQRSGIEQHVKA